MYTNFHLVLLNFLKTVFSLEICKFKFYVTTYISHTHYDNKDNKNISMHFLFLVKTVRL